MDIFTKLAPCLIFTSFCAGELKAGVSYRIRNGYDGSMLSSSYPTYADDLTLKLGKVTTQDWFRGLNQLWTVYDRSNHSTSDSVVWNHIDHYWMKPRAGVLNDLTGVPDEKENIFEIKEITPNSETYLIRQVHKNLCLQNQGLGLVTVFKECNELSTAQQWDFQDPDNLKFKIRLFNQIFSILKLD